MAHIVLYILYCAETDQLCRCIELLIVSVYLQALEHFTHEAYNVIDQCKIIIPVRLRMVPAGHGSGIRVPEGQK